MNTVRVNAITSHDGRGAETGPVKNAEEAEILVVGAGSTGLMLALWLTRLGVKVKVVDSKAGPTVETRAVAVHARTMEFYDQLGLGPEVFRRGRGRVADRVSLWSATGKKLAQVPLGHGGLGLSPHPYTYVFPQDQNEAVLLGGLEALGGAVDWQTELAHFVQDEAGVTATLKRADGQETVRAAFLAGCDGTRSAVRRLAGVTFAGDTPGTIFFVADATVAGGMFGDEFAIRLERDTYLLTMPMPGNRHRIVGQLPMGAGEHPTFEQVRPVIERGGQARVTQVHWFSSYHVHHRVADRFRAGRAFVLGDAGHVHSPVGGQGMNTGRA